MFKNDPKIRLAFVREDLLGGRDVHELLLRLLLLVLVLEVVRVPLLRQLPVRLVYRPLVGVPPHPQDLVVVPLPRLLLALLRRLKALLGTAERLVELQRPAVVGHGLDGRKRTMTAIRPPCFVVEKQ